jgi:hypothetical protein
MSPPNESERRAPATSNGQGDLATDGQGVLSNLPRTRPQRSSARRVAARAANATEARVVNATEPRAPGATETQGGNGAKPRSAAGARAGSAAGARAGNAAGAKASSAAGAKTGRKRASAGRARGPRPAVNVEPAPRQGFESESEHASRAVHPPGGAELVASVAEILGELTKAGVATGERLLKDALSRLPLS